MTTPTITYTIDMNTGKTYTINADKYIEQLNKKNCYEVVPDDQPVKLYLDVDVKGDSEDGETLVEEAPRLMEGLLDCLKGYFGDKYDRDQIAITTCHSPSFIPFGKTTPIAKVSFGFVMNNILALKRHQKLIIAELNKYALTNVDAEDMKIYYKGIVFDEAPYSSGLQKIRSLHSSKPDEQRPKRLLIGNTEQTIITAFIPEDAHIIEMEEPIKTNKVIPTSTVGTSYDKMFIEMGISEGILTKYSINYGDWIRVAWGIKNIFDDKELYHKFSQLAGKSYDHISCDEFWDKMEKKDYGIQMGTLVNMMTESDKVKTKQIQQTITKLKREAELLQKKEEKQQQKIEKIKQQLTEEEEENAREKSITEKWNEEFEKEHCKIKNSALFVRRYTDKEGKASTEIGRAHV